MSNVVYIKRGGEQKELHDVPTRSNRFFKLADSWYFTTREGASMGPYDSHAIAEKSVADYVEFAHNAAPHILRLLTPPVQAMRV